MEPSQFDEFTKAMATPTSRRKALKRLAVGTIGSLLTFAGLRGVLAAEKKCPPGLTDCGGKCVDTKKDPNNCGVCGTKCKSGLCVNGLCCPDGAKQCGNSCCSFTCCGGKTCVNTQTDVNNCGACGNVCSSGQVCQGGKCVTPSCPNGCFNACNPSGTCYCNKTTEGTTACVQPVCLSTGCTSSSQCPPGSICSVQEQNGVFCCGSPACIPLCTGAASSTSVRKYGAAK